jgi:2-dehydro-3-deoxyphosphogluconate aldolase/(4S)-4-hydroxy-2-oxoglutarate aldolase
MDIDEFRKLPLLGILRGIESDVIEPLVETYVSSGLKAIEITMNTKGAPALISQMTKAAAGRLAIGAGTVLALDDLHAAVDAGATFIVSPVLVPQVVDFCVKNNLPVFPGAFTPQEIYNAWNAGATMVKVFPSSFFGPKYFSEIKGPFDNIMLLACGGVNEETIKDFFVCGASAAAFGGSVFKKTWLKTGDFANIGKVLEALVTAYKKVEKKDDV